MKHYYESKMQWVGSSLLGTLAYFLLVSITIAFSSSISAQGNKSNKRMNSMAVEEVVVTAIRREQSLQTVAMGISALSELELEKRGASSLGEYFRTVPGIQYTDFGATGRRGIRQVSIRGLAGVGAGGPLVGYYIDETPIPVSDPDLFDIDRIEFLRGPQGTLYGAGTAGGTIKIVTNKPDPESISGKIDTSVSTTEKGGENYKIKGMINIPLWENKAAFRLVGYYDNLDGYVDSAVAPAGSLPESIANSQEVAEDNFNDTELAGLRATLEFTPTENLTLTPSIFMHRAGLGGEANHHPDFGDLEIVREINTRQRSDYNLYNLTMKYDFSAVSFLSSTSFFESEYRGREDLTNLSRTLFAPFGLTFPEPVGDNQFTRSEQWTQEFRLTSTYDSRLQWGGGFFYRKQNEEIDTLSRGTNVGVAGLPGVIAFAELDIFGTDVEGEAEEFAVFGEVYFDVTDKLKLTLGARWFDLAVDVIPTSFGVLGGGPGVLQSHNEKDIRPKFSLSYQLTNDHMVYALAAKGFRTGGPSDPIPASASCNTALADLGLSQAPDSFDADTIWNYEIGAKTSWAENRLVVNVTGFYVDWADIAQNVSLNQFGDGTCSFSVILNAGEASSKGMEFESWFQPLEGLNLGLTVAYTDATLGNNPAVGAEGDRLLTVPEWTFSLSGEYAFPLTGTLEGFVRFDYQNIDERSFGFATGQVFPSYDLANVRAGINADSWTASIFVDNISDSRPQLGERDFGSEFRRFTTLRPRTIGVRLIKSF